MLLPIFSIAAAVAGAAPASAENHKVQRAPVPDWVAPMALMPVPEGAGGLLFIRRSEALVHLDARGQSQYLGYHIRILHPNALQAGNLSIAWSPAAGAPAVHVLRVHRDGKAIDVLKQTAFEILRREDQLEAASLDGVLTAVLRIPDLRVGDELEVAITTPSSDPTLHPLDSGLLALAPAPPPGRFRIGVSWDEGHKPHLKMSPDMAAAAKQDEAVIGELAQYRVAEHHHDHCGEACDDEDLEELEGAIDHACSLSFPAQRGRSRIGSAANGNAREI